MLLSVAVADVPAMLVDTRVLFVDRGIMNFKVFLNLSLVSSVNFSVDSDEDDDDKDTTGMVGVINASLVPVGFVDSADCEKGKWRNECKPFSYWI